MSYPADSTDPIAVLGPSPAYLAFRGGGQPRPPRATPGDAFDLAMAKFLAGARLDMQELASELGVARTTLYRWTGQRDQLLVDLIWALSEDLVAACLQRTSRLKGPRRIVEALHGYVGAVVQSEAFRAFVENERHAALRLLATRGPYQDRLVARFAELLETEQARSSWSLDADSGLVAYTIVRVIQSFIYNDTAAALEPRVDDAIQMVQLIVGPASVAQPNRTLSTG